ncbi:HAD-IIB family hydrolase [Mycoplasmatota bacterium WC44]
MKYLIGLDIDGTIITDDQLLTKETIEYIKELSDNGHIVSLVTGRPFRTTKPIYDQLGLNTPLANYSGSLLQHPNQKDFPGYKYTMDQKYLLEIFSKYKKGILNAFLEIEDKVYLYKEDSDLRKWLSENCETLEIGDFEGRINHPLCGAVFFISPTISEEMEEFVSNFYSDKLGFRLKEMA